jgi:hypothetical protein
MQASSGSRSIREVSALKSFYQRLGWLSSSWNALSPSIAWMRLRNSFQYAMATGGQLVNRSSIFPLSSRGCRWKPSGSELQVRIFTMMTASFSPATPSISTLTKKGAFFKRLSKAEESDHCSALSVCVFSFCCGYSRRASLLRHAWECRLRHRLIGQAYTSLRERKSVVMPSWDY